MYDSISEMMEKIVDKEVDYDEIYESNYSEQYFVIKFKSKKEAKAAMNDCIKLDDETKILSFVLEGNTLHILTDLDILKELIVEEELTGDDLMVFYSTIQIIAYEHKCLMIDITSHAIVTRK